MKKYFLLLVFLTSCSSVPFQKLTNGVGYTIISKGPKNFVVKVELPKELETKSPERYYARTVGEECLQRGFEYFDFTNPINGISEGFCFKENKRSAFAISFDKNGLNSTPNEFIVESLNQKSITFLQPKDKIIKTNGKNILSIDELKLIAFELGQKNINSVNIELIRQGSVLTISEPMAELTNGCYGPEDLIALRKKYY